MYSLKWSLQVHDRYVQFHYINTTGLNDFNIFQVLFPPIFDAVFFFFFLAQCIIDLGLIQ